MGGTMAPAAGMAQASKSRRAALPRCPPGEMWQEGGCIDVAVSLHALRLEVPCGKALRAHRCVTRRRKVVSTRIAGNLAETYEVTLRLRGVVEEQSYAGGQLEGGAYRGGVATDPKASVYTLRVSEPKQELFLNAGKAGAGHVVPIDREITVLMSGSAKVRLTADARDWRIVRNRGFNGESVIVPDVAPAPKAFDGQFLQVDVVGVTLHESSESAARRAIESPSSE